MKFRFWRRKKGGPIVANLSGPTRSSTEMLEERLTEALWGHDPRIPGGLDALVLAQASQSEREKVRARLKGSPGIYRRLEALEERVGISHEFVPEQPATWKAVTKKRPTRKRSSRRA